MTWFHKLSTMNWGRVALVVAGVTAFWAGLAAIVPERYHKVGMVILASISSAMTLMMRSGKTPAEKAEERIKEYEAEEKKRRDEPEQK